ncbi:MAG: nuclear transport factor 2 family protein [Gemmatimonadota bacterium]|nr:MAG: nuclear transport factor 2 family protein [Gemmatimonadota bacterium]
MRTVSTVLSAVVFLIVGCASPPSELSETERTAVIDDITVVLDSFWGTWEAVDYDRGMSFYLDSPETVFTSGGATIVGFTAINDAFRPVFANVQRQAVNLEEAHINVLSRAAVHVTESGTYTQFDGSGAEITSASFSFSTTWVLRDGDWKIVTCHQSE